MLRRGTILNNYQNKGIKSWTVKDTEDYFHDILNEEEQEKLRVITSKDLSDEEDLNLQCLVAQWYLKKDVRRKDNFIEDLLKTVTLHTKCNDFLIQVYIPVGNDEICFGLKFEGIIRSGIIQIGAGSFQECMLKGLNQYLTNNDKAKAMVIIKGFDTTKTVTYKVGDETVKEIEEEIFHFIIENAVLYGVDIESSARIQEYDFTTQEHIGKRVGTIYKDTNNLVAELEVDNLMYEIGMHSLNH